MTRRHSKSFGILENRPGGFGDMVCFEDKYRGRRVLITGHTGFKGSWLALWLNNLGADVAGFSLDVPTEPSNFTLLGLKGCIKHLTGDIRDRVSLEQVFD